MHYRKVILNNPFAQALVALIIWLVGLVMIRATGNSSYYSVMMASALLLFLVASPMLGVFVKEKWLRYTGLSIAAFAILSSTLYISTHYISTLSPQQSSPRKSVLITLIIFYLMLVLISGIYRTLKQMLEEA